MKTALSIAGSDSSGGAGIQADLKTMTMNGVYGMSAVTALTAQNTTGVFAIDTVSPEFLREQIDAVFRDIPPDAVKVGMVSSPDLVDVIAERMSHYGVKNLVIDPVMVATSGSALSSDETVVRLQEKLIPFARVITPNIPEGEVLTGMKIESKEDMERAAHLMNERFGCAVLLKGGHGLKDADDLLCEDGKLTWFKGERIDTDNTHGTGCTLSSAIASNLAKEMDLPDAIRRAKDYLSKALDTGLNLGEGCGPLNHIFALTETESDDQNPSEQSLSEKMLDRVADLWESYSVHPFVLGLRDGTLDREKFRRYIVQDYLYLVEYAKVFALGLARSKSPETLHLFSDYINVLTGDEMDIHRGYMGRFEITQEELDATPRSLDNLSYTSYMLRIAYEEDEVAILAAILACAISYEAIARRMVEENPACVDDAFYGDWIRGYAADDYARQNKKLTGMLDRLTENLSACQQEHLIDIFENCSRYELGFWDMAWEERD